MTFSTELSLFDRQGQRKYLNKQERHRFFLSSAKFPQEVRLFCRMVYFTGARLSEVADLKVSSLDFSNRTVIIQTLKRRKKGVFRQMPLPDSLLEEVRAYLGTRTQAQSYEADRLWHFSARTASRYIKAVMKDSGVEGHKASARGLRHGFAVQAVMVVPLTQVQLWLGHASLQTTSIYVRVGDTEERELAERLWASG